MRAQILRASQSRLSQHNLVMIHAVRYDTAFVQSDDSWTYGEGNDCILLEDLQNAYKHPESRQGRDRGCHAYPGVAGNAPGP